MELELTQKQFRRLLDMVYIGNWILNSTRGEDRFRDYDEVESLIFARAILEAVAFTLKDDLECIGADASEIRITGGGATSPLWAQIKADVTGLNLSTLQEKESACLGTAIMAGVGCGVYPSIEDACRNIIRTKKTYSPQGVDYTKAYQKYKKLDQLLNISED